MTSLVFDFKDIASRMKGELKARPEVVEATSSPLEYWRNICGNCQGSGQDKRKYWQSPCPHCTGTGVEP